MGWSVVRAQTSGGVGDVCVTATSVVNVDDGLAVDVGQRLGWALLQVLERAYKTVSKAQERADRVLAQRVKKY